MQFVQIQVDGSPANASFSPALVVSDWVFLSGQGAIDAANEIVGGTIEEQTELTLENVERLLRAAGCELSDVVSVLVHLADLADFPAYNAVYERRFPDPKPVRTTVGANLLMGLLVEMTVTARRPGTDEFRPTGASTH
jgi:2-iminobutanoate/2-iminopropanoate deaminase